MDKNLSKQHIKKQNIQKQQTQKQSSNINQSVDDDKSSTITNQYLHQKNAQPINLGFNPNHVKRISNYHTKKIMGLVWNGPKFKTQLASIDQGGTFKIYDCATKEPVQSIQASNQWLTSIDIEKQDGKMVACGTLDTKILIFEINNNKKNQKGGNKFTKDKPIAEMMGHSGSISCLQFLSNKYIIAGSSDSKLSLWDIENHKVPLYLWAKHNNDILSANAYYNDQNIFITGSSDTTTKIWDIRVAQPVQHTFRGHESSVNTVKFVPSLSAPTTFCTGSEDSSIRINDLRMPDILGYLQDEELDGIHQICFGRSGRLIFAATENPQIKVWDMLGDGKVLQNLDIHVKQGQLKGIDMSSDGWTIGVCGDIQQESTPSELIYIY